MNRGRNASMLHQPDLHLSAPLAIPSDSFAPLPESQTRKYLFRVVWIALSQEEQRLGRNATQAQMRKASPPPSDPALLMLSQFDYHLSDATYGDCSTPFTSWYASYKSAARRAETLRSRGHTNIQILVVWAEGLCIFDGYAAARALGYRDEAPNGNVPGASSSGRFTFIALNGTLVRNSSPNVTDTGAGKVGDRPNQVKVVGRCRVLSDHAGEFLLLGTRYVEEQHLVTHFDWHGPIDSVSDRSGSDVKVPRWLVFPEPDQLQKLQQHQKQQQQQQQQGEGPSPASARQFHRSQLNLSSMDQPSKPEPASDSPSRPVAKKSISFASSCSSSPSSSSSSSSPSSLRRRVLIRGRRQSIYERKAPEPSSPQLERLKSTKGIRNSLRMLSPIVELTPTSPKDDENDEYFPYIVDHRHRHNCSNRIISTNTPLTSSPLSMSPRSSRKSSRQCTCPISPPAPIPPNPRTSSLRSPRFTRNNSVISMLLSSSPLSREERYPIPDWNETVKDGDDSSDEEDNISQRLTGRATKPISDGSIVGGSSSSSSSNSSSRSSSKSSRGKSTSPSRRGGSSSANGSGSSTTITTGATAGSEDMLRASVCAPPAHLYQPITPSKLFRAVVERIYLRRQQPLPQSLPQTQQPEQGHDHQQEQAMTEQKNQDFISPRKVAAELLQVMGVHYQGDVVEQARLARLSWQGRWCWMSEEQQRAKAERGQRGAYGGSGTGGVDLMEHELLFQAGKVSQTLSGRGF